MRVPDAMALVVLDAGSRATGGTLGGLVAAFRATGFPVVHVVDTALAAGETPAPCSVDADLDVELLDSGGVQTVGRAEMAVAMASGSAFDGTPLDALLRSFGVKTVVVGGPVPSERMSASVAAAQVRGYRVLLATDELAVTLGAYLRAA